jgi:broad specificity phosphatase PhoE
MALMSVVILIRHVATDLAGYFCGQSDPAINARGREQLSGLLSALRAWRIDSVYSSDLQRARQTAEAISVEFKIPLKLHRALREISFGEWEGLSWSEIERRDSDLARLWMEGYPHQSPPGGEEYGQFVSRVSLETETLFQDARTDRIAVVTHAGVIREILMRQCGVSIDYAWASSKEYGSFIVMDQSGHIIFNSVVTEVAR